MVITFSFLSPLSAVHDLERGETRKEEIHTLLDERLHLRSEIERKAKGDAKGKVYLFTHSERKMLIRFSMRMDMSCGCCVITSQKMRLAHGVSSRHLECPYLES